MKSSDTYPPSESVAPLPKAVAEIGQIHFEGNIIPHPWYQRITLESGKPDLPAIIILAEIVYWYRPYQTLTKGGKPLLRKHFDGDMFQCTAAYFSSKFGLTKDQTRKALKRLEEGGCIRREYRSIVQRGILRNNIMFVEPVPPAILAITHPAVAAETTPPGAPPLSPVGDTLSPVGDTLSPVGDTLSPVGDIYEITTETTTEISTEITTTTTPNPSSTDARAAEPKPTRGRGGDRDKRQEDQVNARGEVQPAPNEDPPGDGIGNPNDQRPALTFPAKLTERELADMTAQVHPLPAEVAQQMLDVIQARIQSGPPIRTNPAAMLRGIVRKYQADPASFDPSTGYHIADQRHRRAGAEARWRAAAESPPPRPTAPETPPVRTEDQRRHARQFVADALRSLRGG
jgi:hypothetical protein